MKKAKTHSIVCGGGWENGSNTEFKEIVTQYGFEIYVKIECLILLVTSVLILLILIEADIVIPAILLTFIALSQPYMIYKIIKTYGLKTESETVETHRFGEPTPIKKLDPHNLY